MESGDRFGDYVIIKRLAAGGMAVVYLARKAGVGGFTKPVAMKVILPQFASNRDFIEMFLNEARLVVCLNHSNIAQILDLGEVNGQYFISMEFAHGADLQQISRKTRKSGKLLPLPYAAKIVSQAAEGLYYAHTKVDDNGHPLGIVHRDISPHNILLTFDGMAKVIDFGIAKAKVTHKEEEEGVLKGKFSYMSPEQIRGMPIDPRSDIFALGIVLWEVCTGASLYREKSELLTMEAILRKPVPKPRELRGDMPPDLEAIILKALAKRAADRFQSAHEMAQALEGYLNRSGWNVGTPHLAEFMRKLFPDEYNEIRETLEAERRKAEDEDKPDKEDFVAWVPYEDSEPVEVKSPVRPAYPTRTPPPHPVASPNSRPMPHPVPGPVHSTPVTRPQPVAPSGSNWVGIAIIVLLALLVVVGCFIAYSLLMQDPEPRPGPAPAPDAVTRGTLHVESDPPGALVFVNGKERGRTPATVDDLPLGEELTVRLEKSGYERTIIPVQLSAQHHTAPIKSTLRKL
ncbi:MAG: protein kinase [Deltaproteobacteria bacterium]|nr:protein kinase [Deltaproteobacteria bacterium]